MTDATAADCQSADKEGRHAIPAGAMAQPF
jgi:hypothetical protein